MSNGSPSYRRSRWSYVRGGLLLVAMIAAAPWVISAIVWYWRWVLSFR